MTSNRRKRPKFIRWGWSYTGHKMHAQIPTEPRVSFCGREITSGFSLLTPEERPRLACASCEKSVSRV